MTETGVLIVGAGAAGLLAANLLGSLGIETLLAERAEDIDPTPMILGIGGAGLRACQAVGLDEAVRAAASLDHGLHLLSAAGTLLRREPSQLGPSGHPRRSTILRADLLRALRAGLARFGNVDTAYHTRLLDFAEEGEGVRATLLGPDGDYRHVRAALLLACDGRESGVRVRLGGDLRGGSFEQRWLVADLAESQDDHRAIRLVCDPARPTVLVAGPEGYRRLAFMLPRGDRIAPSSLDDALAKMLQPWRAGDAGSILGRAVVTVQAVMADKFRRGRVMLLGDAAHALPWLGCPNVDPALQDAFALAWKVALVVKEEAGLQLLDSHEAERRAQLGDLVARSLRTNALVTDDHARRAWLREQMLTATRRLPRRPEPEGRCTVGLFVDDGATNQRSLVGRPLPQADMRFDDKRTAPLDEALGNGFALLRFDGEPAVNCLTHPLWQRIAPTLVTVLTDDRTPRLTPLAETVVCDRTGLFADAARYHAGQFLLVRPDRAVAGAFDPRDALSFADRVQRLLA